MDKSERKGKHLLVFFLLVFVFALPFWIIGFVTQQYLPFFSSLPISALQFMCPALAALVLVYWESGTRGVKELLKRPFDNRRIKNKGCYVPVFLLMPAAMFVEYGLMKLIGEATPDLQFPGLNVPVFIIVFFITAVFEELGWTGYAIEPMQARLGALWASIILGIIWALFHILPWLQGNPPVWAFWQAANTVGLRVLIVWLYNNTGKSLFAASAFHAMSNVGELVWPFYGEYYDPFVHFGVIGVTVASVIFLWGARTLARFRYT